MLCVRVEVERPELGFFHAAPDENKDRGKRIRPSGATIFTFSAEGTLKSS